MALSEGYQRYLAAIGGDAGGLGYGVLAGGLAAAEANTPEARRKKALAELESFGKIADYVPRGALDQAAMDAAENLGLPRTRKEKTGTQRVAKGAPTYIDPTKLSAEDRALYQQAGFTIPEQPQMGLVQVMDPEVRKRYEQAGMALPGAPELKAQYAADLAARDPQAFQRLAQQPGGLAAMQLAAMPEQAKQMRVAQPMQLPGLVEEDVTKEVPFLTIGGKAAAKDALQRQRLFADRLNREAKSVDAELIKLRAQRGDLLPEDEKTLGPKLDERITALEEYREGLSTDAQLLTAGQDVSELLPRTRPSSAGLGQIRSRKSRYMDALTAQLQQAMAIAPKKLGISQQMANIAASRALTSREVLGLQFQKFANQQEWQNFMADANVQGQLMQAENQAEQIAVDRIKQDPNFSDLAKMATAGDPEATAAYEELYKKTFNIYKAEALADRTKVIGRSYTRQRYSGGPAIGAGSQVQRGGQIVVPPLKLQFSK